MHRLALLVALLLAAATPVAHADSVARGGLTASIAQASPYPDRDGDGVPDTVDQCPDQVGNYGGGPTMPVDSDHDGLTDAQDPCPSAAGPNGCPLPDADGDGLLDSQDKCPTVAAP